MYICNQIYPDHPGPESPMSHDQFMIMIRDAENVHLGDALWLFGHMQQPKVGWHKDLPTIASEQDTWPWNPWSHGGLGSRMVKVVGLQ